MFSICAWAFGLFGLVERKCTSSHVTRDSTAGPAVASGEYSKMSAMEVSALIVRLMSQRREAAAASFPHAEATCATPSETSSSALRGGDYSCSAGSSMSGSTPSSQGASSGLQEAACSGPPSLSAQRDVPCSAEVHAAACTDQALQPCWWRGIDLRQHKVLRVLGSGAFGSVTLAEVQLADGSTRQMAVKSLYHRRDVEHIVRREVDGMMAMQGCPYAVQLYGSSLDHLPKEERSQPHHTYQLYMEVADKGTLANELEAAARSNPRPKTAKRRSLLLPETRVAEVAHAVLSALHTMHSAGYAHCDIKPENIFIAADNSCRLGDPGLAMAADPSGVLTWGAGTPKYMAPEMSAKVFGDACRYPVTVQSDMFSVARVLALSVIWNDDKVSWDEYLRWEKDLPRCVPLGLRQLIASMVEEDPAKRPTPLQALGNEWLVGALERARQQREAQAGPCQQ